MGRNQHRLNEIAERHRDFVLPVTADVTDTQTVDSLVETLPKTWSKIDILINNAGHDIGGRQLFHEGTADQWASIIDTNVTGLMRLTRSVIPGMITRKSGHIINMGSVSGLYTYAGGTAYNASKFAVRAFTEALRKDYAATPIRVTELLPGMVRTGFAVARLSDHAAGEKFYDSYLSCLEPQDIANAVVYAIQQPPHVNVSQIVIEPTQIGSKA